MENLTAKVSCFARAYHYRNNTAHIFADTAAEALLGEDYDHIAESMTQGVSFFLPDFHGAPEEGLRLIMDRQLSPSVLGRSAYCESMLENEVHLGCRQVVILASGYDTFAIRNSNASLSVYEMDLPEVLADKERRIEKAGLESRGIYVPCDLSDASWRDKLTDSGFRCDQKSFASLLGISYYLGKDEFKYLLAALGDIMCEGSAICYDYQSHEDSPETTTNQVLAQGAGERMKAQYDEQEMASLLEEYGFLVYEHLNHKGLTDQYFSDYNHRSQGHPMEAPKGVCYVLTVRKSRL